MKRAIIIAAMLAATGLAGAQMFAQLFGATGTPIPAVAWYKLDGNALDSSGNGYDGTWSGAAAYAAGKFAGTQGAWFNGAQLITLGTGSLGDVDFFPTTGKSHTIAFWVKFSEGFSLSTYLFSKRTSSASGIEAQIRVSNPNVYACYRGTVSGVTSVFSTIVDGSWHHLVLSWDGDTSTATFTLDGTQSWTTGVGSSPEAPSALADIMIGGRVGYNFLVGTMADVRVYDRALSPANIARIMEAQNNEPLEELQ